MKIKISIAVVLLTILLAACSKMNDLHDIYLKDGETIYIAKFDSMYIYSGRERAMMKYWLSDPKAQKCVIKWSLGQDSVIKDIHVTTPKEPGILYIDNLEEGNISFDIINKDQNFKYASVKDGYSINVYGDNFQATLMNASYKNLKHNPTTYNLTYTWTGNYDNTVGYQVNYVDRFGASIDTVLPIATKDVTIKDFPAGGSFQFRTLYLPEPTAIDTFYTDYRNVKLP